MVDPAEALRQHLERARDAYGLDLPLAVPRPEPAPAAVRPRAEPARPPAPPATTAAAPAAAPAPAPASPPPAAAPTPTPMPMRPAAPGPRLDPTAAEGRAAALADLRREVMPCTRCKLHEGRRTTVFGEGSPAARVLFVGEAPGAVEDQTGRPFVGPAGQLLDKILQNAMGLRRDEVFIANINKCRPPGNREPQPDEVAACLPFLRRQIEILQPEVIVCLGRTAAQNLLGTTASTTALRGRELAYEGIPVVVTWHPAYLLRDPSHKRETWDDVKRVNRLLGNPEVPPAAGTS